ncbi:hypothetical protein [Pseudomonas viridiflava]|uniref:hypothetical protein n=1 Tax=Pseudomonas viridiflava TaxID=33069 RepID=UPI000F01A97D|nr:hypothetical protein [Pseudomonas viridiflava]
MQPNAPTRTFLKAENFSETVGCSHKHPIAVFYARSKILPRGTTKLKKDLDFQGLFFRLA